MGVGFLRLRIDVDFDLIKESGLYERELCYLY